MSTLKIVSLLIMATLYIVAGISHFRKPSFFLKITPTWVPYPKKINLIVGGIEIIAGLLLLFSQTRLYAVWTIILLLIIVFPANVYHFQKALRKQRAVLMTLLRLPLQLLLIYWAYSFIS